MRVSGVFSQRKKSHTSTGKHIPAPKSQLPSTCSSTAPQSITDPKDHHPEKKEEKRDEKREEKREEKKEEKREEKKDKTTVVKKKKKELADKKVDVTQEDVNEEPVKEPASVMEAVVKEDKGPVKMDDGYEDFGPGAAT